jgi:HlyD family secretion protein
MFNAQSRRWLIAGAILAGAAIGAALWLLRRPNDHAANFSSGNGRIEATEYDISTKLPGRIAKVFADEGDMVQAEQVLVRMDTVELEATLRQTEAEWSQAREDKQEALAVVAQRESDVKQSLAEIVQRESEVDFAVKEFERFGVLVKEGAISKQEFDRSYRNKQTAEAALLSQQAGKLTAEAALRAARIQVFQKDAAIDAAQAKIHRVKAQIEDSILKTPIPGRVLYRLAEPGEVLAAGGKVLTVLDLTDVYLTIFLPTELAGRLVVGAEARIILDAVPQFVIPATVSFVSPRSQFTPKEVETKTEREKLMFRVKVQIAPELLKKYLTSVKTGLPGVGYVKLQADVAWPGQLRVKLPNE